MVIKKITKGKNKGKYGVYHCSSGRTGLIKAFPTKEKALSMHKAIIISKQKRRDKNV